MDNLNKEDIQAIAQELHKLQSASASAQKAQPKTNKGETKPKPKGETKPPKLNNIASIALLIFWGVVFVIFLIKLAPYI